MKLLFDLLIILSTAILVTAFGQRLKIPVVVGFIITGIIIGPGGLALIENLESIQILAEIGVILLLFMVGIEFSFERLKKIQKIFWIGGSFQVASAISLTYFVMSFLKLPPQKSLFYGFLLSLSSTAVVLKLLADKNEIDSPRGRLSLGLLLFQDIAIIPMLAITPLLAYEGSISFLSISQKFLLSFILIGSVFYVARQLMPKLLRFIIRLRIKEIYLLFALSFLLAMSLLTSSFGMSLALGAFLAGLIISESEYSPQIVSDVIPFKDVFNSLFFISIGMLLNTAYFWNKKFLILQIVAGLIISKIILIFLSIKLLKFDSAIALSTALGLAQTGEFSFVLAGVGRIHNLMTLEAFQIFIAASIVTILLTPLFINLTPQIITFRREKDAKRKISIENKLLSGLENHVIIAGFGLNGQNLARVLKETGIPYVILEINPETVRRASEEKEPIIFGDVSSPVVLREAGIDRAAILVLAISDPGATRRAVQIARNINPRISIIVRTRFVSEIEELYRLGANDVIPEEFETSIEIFVRVLEKFHLPRNIINTQVQIIRSEGYGLLRGSRSTSRRIQEKLADFLEMGIVETFLITKSCWINGQTLSDLDLRQKTGVTVIAVIRDGQTQLAPGGDFRLKEKDILILVGNHQNLERAFTYLTEAKYI
ncbi:MAG: cation:proton antiporter [Candidatus Aminicenantes bacterium]|nr:cation:proton antiporter [Candidatus Aminicenantes bacterium]